MMNAKEWREAGEKMAVNGADESSCTGTQTTFVVLHVGGQYDMPAEVPTH